MAKAIRPPKGRPIPTLEDIGPVDADPILACPDRLTVKVDLVREVRAGARGELVGDGGTLWFVSRGRRLAHAVDPRGAEVLVCLARGYRYLGRLINDGAGWAAAVEQS